MGGGFVYIYHRDWIHVRLCYGWIVFDIYSVLTDFSFNWDIMKAIFGFAALIALFMKVDILHVVLIGAVISVFML